jgi:hypothetical protein
LPDEGQWNGAAHCASAPGWTAAIFLRRKVPGISTSNCGASRTKAADQKGSHMGILEVAKPVAIICTRDRARAAIFYRDTLGLKMKLEDDYAVVFDVGGIDLRVSTFPISRRMNTPRSGSAFLMWLRS